MPVIAQETREAVLKSLKGFEERQLLRNARRRHAAESRRIWEARKGELGSLATARSWLQQNGMKYRESVKFGVTILRTASGFELNYRPDGVLDYPKRNRRRQIPENLQAEMF